jgi:hypothetical protein
MSYSPSLDGILTRLKSIELLARGISRQTPTTAGYERLHALTMLA